MMLMFIIKIDKAYSQSWISLEEGKTNNDVTISTIESNIFTHRVKVIIHGLHDKLIKESGMTFHQLYIKEGGFLLNIGEPQLPTISQLIAIPEGATYKVSIKEEEWSDIDIGKIFPFQEPCLETALKPEFAFHDSIYRQEIFESPLIQIGEEMLWCNIRNVNVSICPFKYYPINNKLSVLKNFVVQVDFINTHKSSRITPDAIVKASKWHMFCNDISTFPTKQDKKGDTKSISSSECYDFLIIVGNIPNILNSQALKDFQKWKAFKGYKTKVVSTTTTGTNSNSIKNYIAQEAENGVKYVLLVGNHNKIPSAYVNSPLRNVLSDYWYGCLDGDNDFEAEIPIGRFSISSLSDFQNMVKKTIAYESSYNGNYQKSLLVAHKENAPRKYQECSDSIKTAAYSVPLLFSTAYGASSNVGGDNATNTLVVNHINSGMHIVNYRGHGNIDLWGGGWNVANEAFYATEIENIDTCSIYFNVCCQNGNLRYEPCFMESFTRSQYGAIACIAATENSYTSPNHVFDKKLFSKLLNANVWHIGDLDVQAHIATFSTTDLYGKDNAYVYLCGGDPSLEIWTSTPSVFTNVNLTKSDGLITISSPTFCPADVISVVSEGGELIDTYIMVGNTCTFTIPSDDFYIVVNRHNYYPFNIYCSTSNHIQNKTFSSDAYYDAYSMNIGYDVTEEETYGNVVINPGAKLLIKNRSQVNIKNGFECKIGGELLVE